MKYSISQENGARRQFSCDRGGVGTPLAPIVIGLHQYIEQTGRDRIEARQRLF